MEDFDVMGVLAILALFIGLPWIVLHYVTKWRHAAKITPEDENMLDEMYNLARRLEDRVQTVERIIAADHPEFRPGLSATQHSYSIDRRN